MAGRTWNSSTSFDVPETTAQVTVSYGRQVRRTAAVLAQLAILLLTLSVLLRPPSTSSGAAPVISTRAVEALGWSIGGPASGATSSGT